MIIEINYNQQPYRVDLSQPTDISLPLAAGPGHVLAWYLSSLTIEPVRMGDWVGEVKSGAAVNFRNIAFNPHGHGTHTESVGHISPELYSVNKHFREFFCFASLVSVQPEKTGDDWIISTESLRRQCPKPAEAIIIRTIPNSIEKQSKTYSSTNPPYLEEQAALWLRESGVRHLLIDLPSVDREEDGGKLLSHHAFWNYPSAIRTEATITELIFVPDELQDGLYFMNLQTAPFENDATPSRPLLFKPELIL